MVFFTEEKRGNKNCDGSLMRFGFLINKSIFFHFYSRLVLIECVNCNK